MGIAQDFTGVQVEGRTVWLSVHINNAASAVLRRDATALAGVYSFKEIFDVLFASYAAFYNAIYTATSPKVKAAPNSGPSYYGSRVDVDFSEASPEIPWTGPDAENSPWFTDNRKTILAISRALFLRNTLLHADTSMFSADEVDVLGTADSVTHCSTTLAGLAATYPHQVNRIQLRVGDYLCQDLVVADRVWLTLEVELTGFRPKAAYGDEDV